MTEILQFSDFALRIYFINLDGVTTDPPLRFKFLYSTPFSKTIEVSYDGENYLNCSPIEGGILATFVRPEFNLGQLKVHRSYTIKSDMIEKDGQRNIVELLNLPMKIVNERTTPIVSGKNTNINILNEAFGIIETVATDLKNVEIDPNEPQPRKGIDYSMINVEQPTGDTWLSNNCVTAKPIFTQTFKIVTPAEIGQGVEVMKGIDSLFNVKVIFNTSQVYASGSNLINYYHYTVGSNGTLYFSALHASRLNTTVVITIEYTKA